MREKKQKIISALITFLLRWLRDIWQERKKRISAWRKKEKKKIIDKNFSCMLNRRYDYCKVGEKKKV